MIFCAIEIIFSVAAEYEICSMLFETLHLKHSLFVSNLLGIVLFWAFLYVRRRVQILSRKLSFFFNDTSTEAKNGAATI